MHKPDLALSYGATVVADSPELRKSRGAFFTPPAIADFLTRWAIRSPGDIVLEPSCGDAAFLTRAAVRLRELGADGEMDLQLHACEIHEASAQAAEAAVASVGGKADIFRGDFFEAPLLHGAYDAVIGNPPYIRYQEWTGAARAKARQAALAAGRPLTALASSWAAFTIRSGELAKPNGRLALVLPAELLTVNYAAPVRSYLMDRFARVRLVLFEERVFPGVLEEVVLLLAEGEGPTDHLEVSQLRDEAELTNPITTRWRPPENASKWTPALIEHDAAETYAEVLAAGVFEVLQDWGETDLGMVSGNNRYFTLTEKEARQWGLDQASLLPISPPGSRHLRGLTFTDTTWRKMIQEGARGFLFYPGDEPTPAEQRYIEHGEERGVHRAYKCRVRSPWWRVPLVDPPDLFFTYMNHDTARLTTNRAGVRHLNSIHGVRLHQDRRRIGQDLLPIASLNSITLLGAELVGRSYGGGILKLEPREADQLPVPSFELVESAAADLRALRPQLGTALRNGRLNDAVAMIDRILRAHANLRHNDIEAIRRARNGLYARRATRNSNGTR